MITRQMLLCHLNELYAVQQFQDSCPNGLQVEGCPYIERVAVAVSATLETIQQAVRHQCQALIVHHGLFWNRDPYPVTGSKKEKLSLLLKNEISLLAYHLPMDAHASIGNNWKAALDLGMFDLTPFGCYDKMFIGVRGKRKPESVAQFKKSLEEYYQHPAHTAFGGRDTVEEIAIISGGAYKMLHEAVGTSIDAFITGSFDLPAWNEAREGGINFFAMGHHASERVGPKALLKHLESTLGIPCVFVEEDNPF
ncbi:Nif3-like dinuclear metal center hexameric protein [Estrella lausannensis]|uniref:Nif3-like dinuclear metal center hexameric protein n=1 Tax=Estrella lausannensis TaxID=483423 RepID=A0A0H5E5C2_9BACT|nr:Nif3-like dinuclear metal center hexameric protein [Estrella lausannensis]CRX38440.1 Conserved hypothetical protein [Estrella lausannensis]